MGSAARCDAVLKGADPIDVHNARIDPLYQIGTVGGDSADPPGILGAMSNSVYDEAKKPGGDNHGFYVEYHDKGSIQIDKAIRSLAKRTDEHEEKIRTAELLRDRLPDVQVDALKLHKWPNEIRVFRAQIDILRAILKEREHG